MRTASSKGSASPHFQRRHPEAIRLFDRGTKCQLTRFCHILETHSRLTLVLIVALHTMKSLPLTPKGRSSVDDKIHLNKLRGKS
jgi:hypothetical protein